MLIIRELVALMRINAMGIFLSGRFCGCNFAASNPKKQML